MNDAVAMSFVQRIRNLDRVSKHLVNAEASLPDARGQGFPFDVFQNEILVAIVPADIVQSADVRVIQAGDGTRFALEPLRGRTVRELLGNNFDSDGSPVGISAR